MTCLLLALGPPRGGGDSDGSVRCFGTNGRPSRWSSLQPCITAVMWGLRRTTSYGQRRQRAQVVGRASRRSPSRREGQSRSVTWLPRVRSSRWRRWLAVTASTAPPSGSSSRRPLRGRRRRSRRRRRSWRSCTCSCASRLSSPLLTNVPWSKGQVLSRTGKHGPLPARQGGERKRGRRRRSF